MGVEADELIIRPFREVVERGAEAVANAETEDADPEVAESLAKAARAVVREGERALKKLQPIWDGQVEKYGDAFKDAMMQQDDIEKKRRELEDLLYDFEDYTELDSFDADKFAEIQTATKSFALVVIDLTKRLKVEVPKRAFPPLPPLPPIPRDDRRATAQLLSRSPIKTVHPRIIAAASEPLPEDHADNLAGSVTQPAAAAAAIDREKRPPAAQSIKRAATKSSIQSSVYSSGARAIDRIPSSPDLRVESGDQFRAAAAAQAADRGSNGTPTTIPRTSSWVRKQAAAPRTRAPLPNKASREALGTEAGPSGGLLLTRLDTMTLDGSARSTSGSVFDAGPSPVLTDSRTSFFSSSNSYASTPSQLSPRILPDGVTIDKRASPHLRSDQTDDVRDFIKFDPVPTVPPITLPVSAVDTEYENGLMLVEEEVARDNDTVTTIDVPTTREFNRETDCSIGPTSSFHTLGGFCKGAQAFRIGGHWQGIRKQAGFVANKQSAVGRCVGCGYAHNYDEITIDIDKKPEANFNKFGARFRVRLLYKSHISNAISNQRMAESLYGCLFCLQTSSTVREGDATVFTSPDALLLHLVRHPQPLPPVPGVTVVYGPLAPTDPHAEDFDLHFPNPPLPTPVPPTVGKSAVATAVKDFYQRHGAKKLERPRGYSGDLLQFLTGGRIVGITFPEGWDGKWCMGWHDGMAGAFPAKAVEIEPPRQSEIPMESTSSGMSVTARWKWKPKREGEGEVWLEFEKGETISNVRCLYADHWCWSGSNSKGKYGVFPQSHIVLKTLQQEGVGRLPIIKKSKTRGLLSRRPTSSSAASSVSGSTAGRSSNFT